MTTLGEQLQNRIRVSEKVIASARTHGPKIAAILADYAVTIEGPGTPATAEAFKAVIYAAANGLEHATKGMRETEHTVAAEKADDVPVRQKREEACSEVGGLLVRLRSAVEDHLGAEGVRTYGLASEGTRVPRKVLEYAQNVVQLLEKAPVKIASPFGGSFDSAVAAATLSAKAAILAGFIVDDDREARELEDAYALRDRAVAAWSDAYQGAAAMLEGLYRRAGWKELAEKVRPTLRKVRGEEVGDDIEGAPPEGG
ncbi:MAG: hypothetical protein IPM54_08960 [Polyangiaceae bacterium]|nr:hypothetical protein [Polyangiaceae bacterium]